VEASAGLWGQWLSSQSLDRNVGPRPLIPAIGVSDTTPQLTSQPPNTMLITEPAPTPATSHFQPSNPPSPSNQCVFVRGFQISDRKKWFQRRKTRIDVSTGFKVVPRPSASKSNQAKEFTTRDGSQQQLPSPTSSYPQSGTPHVPQNELPPDSDDKSLADIEENNTAVEAIISYIFEVYWLLDIWFHDTADAPIAELYS
jgi:hypothetical protein